MPPAAKKPNATLGSAGGTVQRVSGAGFDERRHAPPSTKFGQGNAAQPQMIDKALRSHAPPPTKFGQGNAVQPQMISKMLRSHAPPPTKFGQDGAVQPQMIGKALRSPAPPPTKFNSASATPAFAPTSSRTASRGAVQTKAATGTAPACVWPPAKFGSGGVAVQNGATSWNFLQGNVVQRMEGNLQRGNTTYSYVSNSSDQGPHTTAHAFMKKSLEEFGGDWGMLFYAFYNVADTPEKVTQIFQSEVSGFVLGATGHNKNGRLNQVINEYRRIYAEINEIIEVYEQDYNERDDEEDEEDYERGLQLLMNLMDLHPYGTYAWKSVSPKRSGKKASKKSTKSKNERQYLDIIFSNTTTDFEKEKAASGILDCNKKSFTDVDSFKEFLENRLTLYFGRDEARRIVASKFN